MTKEIRINCNEKLDIDRIDNAIPYKGGFYIKKGEDLAFFKDRVFKDWCGFYIRERYVYSHKDGEDYVFLNLLEIYVKGNCRTKTLIGNHESINKFADRWKRMIERSGEFEKSKRTIQQIIGY